MLEKTKSRKNRKKSKSQKIEKSKKSKRRKLFDCLTFCEKFHWKSDTSLGVFQALEHRQHARRCFLIAVLLLFLGVFFVLFLGAHNANLQLPRQDHIAHTMLWIPLIGGFFVDFERADTGNPQTAGLHNSYLRDLTMVIKHVSGSGLGILTY